MNPPSKKKVRKFYNALGGKLYDIRYKQEQYEKYDPAILLTFPKYNDLILDAGCGTGMMMQKIDSQIVGLDISNSLIQSAYEKKSHNHYFILADIENLPFSQNIFSICYLMTIIQNIPNKVRALNELKRVSKQGSQIIITALKAAFSESMFKEILENVGFTSIELIGDAGTNDWIAFIIS